MLIYWYIGTMPRISRIKLNNQELTEINDHFSHLVSSLRAPQIIENFLDEFLTKEEKIMLAKRLVLFTMIKRGYPTSIIQSALNMSHETIRLYRSNLSFKSKNFQR